MQQWDFFFALVFLSGLNALRRLSMVREEGEVEEKIIAQELFSEVRTLSSIESVKQMVSFPISMVRNFTVKNITNGNYRKN